MYIFKNKSAKRINEDFSKRFFLLSPFVDYLKPLAIMHRFVETIMAC